MRERILAASVALLACSVGFSSNADAAPTVEIVHSFAPGEARYPGSEATLVQGPGNMLYGVSQLGGQADKGTVYSFNTRTGRFKQLHSFSRPDGGDVFPQAVVVGPAGEILVTTYQGGSHDYGTIYLANPMGGAVEIHSFDGADIGRPVGRLVAYDGYFYGTGYASWGSVFRFDVQGNTELLHAFPSPYSSPDEAQPFGLSAGAPGVFYGATWGWYAPPQSHGAVYSLNADGQYAVMHFFNGADGSRPFYAPVRASDGNLYGTTAEGGPNPDACGVVYRLTPTGTFDVFHSFDFLVDGCSPMGGLLPASNGKLYGVNGAGVFYVINPATQRFRVLLRLDQITGGPESIQSALIETAPRVFYGVSSSGGQYGQGTIYKIKL